ncbi:aminotransferase class I/II-fold pyridoxal phosphate-dependent enzyme [Labilibaculum euxinus]|uniref:GDP-perosamine synthase n=1 Tax=Labilibaculum euxinus TaxID=2686357 RepID=A0A7M4DAG6_9BACT|nr:aminotransferase class I/II-fold pyridoxal phosphate-dependent enzyme [Labilibaculum euxinus]MUP39645.1 aminotransferase class I/II-fold pyridoxal phosphate-dependent enzyme [Labilibaculum euxinus]MVB08850.1 aminotransferase class I/II-fold pyridoxal phosphate-dependent enzyme [Labilibaculum euxinus]
MKSKIWLSSPHMGGNEMKYVQEAYDTNWVAPLGPNVNGFEADLQNYTGTKHAAALSAGTAAIHLSLILLGVKAGDEVIASSFTFSATVNPISYVGASPILVDSEAETWNMCPIQLEKAINDRIAKGKKPKAIVVVYLYGMPGKIEELLAVANKYDIPLIEDAAEALGSKYKGKCMGTFGKFGILSFNGNKIITTSGGGALISDDQELIEKSRFLATQARDNAPHYQHSHIGYNYRMSNIVAGIGRGQMEVLEERVAQRRANFEFYKELFSDIAGVSLQEEPSKDFFSNFWLTSILIDPSKTGGITREEVRLGLEQENIECRPLWKPMHMQPVFAACPYYGNGTSEELFEKGLCLPSGSNLNKEDKRRIKEVLLRVLNSKK